MDLICFGDSLTNGEIGCSYRSYLDKNHKTINKGIDGDTTEGMYLRLKNFLQKDNIYEYYIIFIGINDVLFSFSNEQQFTSIYEKIVKLLKENNKKVIFISLPFVEFYNFDTKSIISRNKIINALCKKYNFLFINIFDIQYNEFKKEKKLTIDGVHFNEYSAKLLAKELNKIIKDL
ncbi:SGNH/GDSL hydrolase family protein [Anaerofustis sp. NSJ-163]|nr:SGNH/GDSL hydrolase family protein [Anaerofustis sp. NSJ-163]MCO8194102.1 SGNH/GDSL hydrolase family protein [Anaerofustis sp. NSJ-163]